MATAGDILALAAAELGYNRYDDEEEGTKYGRWYAATVGDRSFAASGVPFCAMGVSYILAKAGMTPPGGFFAYVPYGINNARARGRLVPIRAAVAGDLACFDWDGDGLADHIGFVEANRGSYLQTIEFNTSGSHNGSQSNGGGVYRRTRKWDGICAVIRPEYSNAVGIPMGVVAGYQTIPDGWWGTNTTRDLQRAAGTPVDGVVSDQSSYWRPFLEACQGGWEWVPPAQSGGSLLICAMQRAMGISVDGVFGAESIAALQDRHGIPRDGRLSGPSATVVAMQRALARTGRF